MNYQAESLRNALAAEYVLGTLRGGARRRYQKLIMSNQTIAETTWLWEQYLNGMGETIAPVAPDARVWQSIQQKLGFVESNVVLKEVGKGHQKQPTGWRNMVTFAIAASILIAVIWTAVGPSLMPPVTQIAVVNNQQSQPLWLIEISDRQLRVRATEQLTARVDKDFELWIVPADGTAPVSLGVLPKAGEKSVAAPESLKRVPINVLAVSLEPLGGSPTGQPTEVLYTSALTAV
ncbi:anti-sigma factor [Aliiglaciecola sp. CAU 1673]|uniref:anti-sigma factor n=1 Tax=Aliiglaciecola sp. CAU 1673 TaxID=3032595 RepID=UPI0023D9ADCA|nr:anti-sigma factor [Aliiglaciecola sp. CAU 1673]MDF2179776.1 anti-sigma factor [Aliiglaciecola sp. CAU 1673]